MNRFVLITAVLALSMGRCVAAEPNQDHPAKAIIKTALGDLVLRLDWEKAPENSATFVKYVRDGVYSKTSFHEPDETAFHGGIPSQAIPGVASNGNMACNRGPVGEFQLPNKRGSIGFRRTVGDCNPQKRSNCTQIYVRFKDSPQSDGEFTIFATVEGDLQLVDAIQAKLLKKEIVPFTISVAE